MTYDMNLIVLILEYVAQHGRGNPLYHPEFKQYDETAVDIHMTACIKDKLVYASDSGHATQITMMGQNTLAQTKEQITPGETNG